MNNIIALTIVSASDVAKVYPEFTYEYMRTNKKEFEEILFNFGMNIYKMYEIQENVVHRNLEGKVVQCDRFVGDERLDEAWLASNYASNEAWDKASGSNLLNDLYRFKGLSA